MRSLFLVQILLIIASALSGQVVIQPGAQFYIAGNGQVTLQNTSLVNNGSFVASNGSVTFSGTANSTISGSQPIQFYELQINKTVGSSLILQRSIAVSHRIVFTSGLIHLSSFNADLGATGFLNGEHENSRITSNGEGVVISSTVLNAPSNANPGNLGAIISSAQNLGNVTIMRGHESQVNGSGTGNSIRRFYDILPTNTAGVNATLRLQYFDQELNALNENTLVLYKSDDLTTWLSQGFSSRNVVDNYVEQTGISSFRRWTLSGAGNALPLHFTLFNVRCEGSNAMLTWKTGQEQNTSRFDIQKSTDGIQWAAAASVPAAGYSTSEKSYSYTDHYSTSNSYYRIAGYDLDGKVLYTSVLRSPCSSKEVFRVWPNPAQRSVFVNVNIAEKSMVTIKVFDVKGAVMKEQRVNALAGSNQFTVDISSLPNGIYAVFAEWNNGQMKQTTQIIKQ